MGELRTKSYAFAIRIVKLSQYLNNDRKEYVLSKQILKSGTSVGAMIRESEFGQSKADFISKLSIGLKEANETDYWLSLLKDTDFIDLRIYDSLKSDIDTLIKLLVASIKTAKNNQNKT
jgi:four helix bundle protein